MSNKLWVVVLVGITMLFSGCNAENSASNQAGNAEQESAAVPATPAEQEGYGKQKVVYHINYDDPKSQAGALRNIQNHINAVGAENLDLKVVMHGKGLSLLLTPGAVPRTKLTQGNATDEIQAKIAGLKNQGIEFRVCANTLKGKQIDSANDLYDVDNADIVPSGVAELAHLQGMGYAYIKP